MVMMVIRRAIIIINGGTQRIGKTIRTMIMMINATHHGSRQAMCNTIGVYFLKVAPMLQPTVTAFKVFSLHCISSRWRCNVAWAVMMVRLVMGREGQTTFGYCLLLLSSSSSSSPSPASISSPSSLSPPYCFYCPNCNHWSNLYSSSGKIYVGDYKYDKEDGIGVLRFFTRA